jgi:hypothetical protein
MFCIAHLQGLLSCAAFASEQAPGRRLLQPAYRDSHSSNQRAAEASIGLELKGSVVHAGGTGVSPSSTLEVSLDRDPVHSPHEP